MSIGRGDGSFVSCILYSLISVSIWVIWEADTETELVVQQIYCRVTPVEEKKRKKQDLEKKPSDCGADLAPVRGKERKKDWTGKLKPQCRSDKASPTWNSKAKMPIRGDFFQEETVTLLPSSCLAIVWRLPRGAWPQLLHCCGSQRCCNWRLLVNSTLAAE